MASEREDFETSGPLHLTNFDWTNVEHQRIIAACLVQSVYILELDRYENREGSQALANPWWEFFHFKLYIAFRGTITKGAAFARDVQLDIDVVRNGLHRSSRFEVAVQAVENLVAAVGHSTLWLSGHSLGAAMALLAGKNMAKKGIFLETFLFNPPYFSAPIERIQDKKVKHGIRFAGSVITAGLAFGMKVRQEINGQQQNNNQAKDPFDALSAWLPRLYVNPGDHICSEYIGYFEHRRNMEDIGAGVIEKFATKHSMTGLFMSAIGKETEEPLHLIPSAKVIANLSPSKDFKEAHGIKQWWKSNLDLKVTDYRFK
ncbi:GDSL esterase/lipase At4g10955-like isoform X2 [Apium graveolens]|uniref:GDSL esterase/lipase At4g10955-like isoform X2 n=1 Tax=Apium graveolens TaxID=4045 RepID=UPI003D7A89A3